MPLPAPLSSMTGAVDMIPRRSIKCHLLLGKIWLSIERPGQTQQEVQRSNGSSLLFLLIESGTSTESRLLKSSHSALDSRGLRLCIPLNALSAYPRHSRCSANMNSEERRRACLGCKWWVVAIMSKGNGQEAIIRTAESQTLNHRQLYRRMASFSFLGYGCPQSFPLVSKTSRTRLAVQYIPNESRLQDKTRCSDAFAKLVLRHPCSSQHCSCLNTISSVDR